jgi:hypothetical protein
MKLLYYPPSMSYQALSDKLHRMADDNHVVLVEVFDHRHAIHGDLSSDDRGVWIVGEYADVHDQLAADGLTDFAIQESIDHTGSVKCPPAA